MNPKYIAALGPNLWIDAICNSDVQMTCIEGSAKQFNTRSAAWAAIEKAQRLEPGKFKKAWVHVALPDAPDIALALHDPGSREAGETERMES